MWWTSRSNREMWKSQVFGLPGVIRQPIQFASESDSRGRMLRIPIGWKLVQAVMSCWLQNKLLVVEFLPPKNPSDEVLYTTIGAFSGSRTLHNTPTTMRRFSHISSNAANTTNPRPVIRS